MAFRLPRIRRSNDGYYGGFGFKSSTRHWKPGTEPPKKRSTKPRRFRGIRLRRRGRGMPDDAPDTGSGVAFVVMVFFAGLMALVLLMGLLG